jgi:hypothetical protein
MRLVSEAGSGLSRAVQSLLARNQSPRILRGDAILCYLAPFTALTHPRLQSLSSPQSSQGSSLRQDSRVSLSIGSHLQAHVLGHCHQAFVTGVGVV